MSNRFLYVSLAFLLTALGRATALTSQCAANTTVAVPVTVGTELAKEPACTKVAEVISTFGS